MRLHWTDYKLDKDERQVWLGDLSIYAIHTERDHLTKRERQWCITWYNGRERVPEDEVPGLTDQWFDSLLEAMYAAERYFVPFLKLVSRIAKVDSKVSIGGTGWKEDS